MKTDLIRQRKSVRTFDGRPLSAEDRAALANYCASISNPFSVPITFRLLDAKAHGLSSPVIVGADTYQTATSLLNRCLTSITSVRMRNRTRTSS